MADDPAVVVEPFGDAAFLITLAPDASEATAARAQAVARRIRTAAPSQPGWAGVVPAAASILVHLDPAEADVAAALPELRAIAAHHEADDDRWPDDAPRIDVPVRYGGADGPDLESVAEATGLTAAQVVELHASKPYRVLFLGFAPGFAYLGPLPAGLVLARRSTPRVRVPAGTVAIAGPYTAVYPIESPGGWHLLGRTEIDVWDPARRPPALLEAGAIVRFVPERR